MWSHSQCGFQQSQVFYLQGATHYITSKLGNVKSTRRIWIEAVQKHPLSGPGLSLVSGERLVLTPRVTRKAHGQMSPVLM